MQRENVVQNKQSHAELAGGAPRTSASSTLVVAVTEQQRLKRKIPNQVWNDSLFNNIASGFTLIELLVVVLIIGILASVALPQYQKAVEKSKATQAITLLHAMHQAAEVYYIENGEWPTSAEKLDIEIPTNLNGWRVEFKDEVLSNGRGANTSISIMRTEGPFLGAGFIVYKNRDSFYKSLIELERILCVENKMHPSASNKFTQKQGSYCQKIIQGTLLSAADGNPIFRTPY